MAERADIVHIEGLDELLKGLKTADPEIRKALRKALRQSVKPVLQKARANARGLGGEGRYARSMSLGSRRAGAMWILKSTDEAAGVKEYAHHGARYTPRANDKRPNARKMGSFPVGVPRGEPPRAMIPAVEDSTDQIKRDMEFSIEWALEAVIQRCHLRA